MMIGKLVRFVSGRLKYNGFVSDLDAAEANVQRHVSIIRSAEKSVHAHDVILALW